MGAYISINHYHHVLVQSMCFNQFFSGAPNRIGSLIKLKTGLLIIVITFVELNNVDVSSVHFLCKKFLLCAAFLTAVLSLLYTFLKNF